MNILVLASEYPYEKDKNADRTKVVGYFAREWVKKGHNVVAIVDSSSFPSAYYAVGDRLKALVTRTFDVSRTPDRIWSKRFSYDADGVHVENIPMIKYIPHGRFSEKVISKQIKEIEKILQERNFVPDLITGHWVNPQIMLVPVLARRYVAKSAFVFHADYMEANCKKFNVQKYIDQIDHIGFRSKSAAELAKQYLKFKEEPFVASSGVPDEFIEKYSEAPVREIGVSTLHIITAARLVEYKKIDTIISAAAKAFDGNAFELTIAGDGPLKSKLIEQARELGINDNVHFIGQIARDVLQDRMRRSDIFVLISRRETFGLVYIEAMLHGCIVIASRFGGVDGIIEDGVNGFLCEEGNVEELIDIFKRIKKMPLDEMENISKNATITAANYSESKVACHYIECVQR